MSKTQVDNDLYRRLGKEWWNEDVGEFSTIRFFVNPVRFGYFERVLRQWCGLEQSMQKLLDVGCGGGLLAEEFARSGLLVTGIDPAAESIETARAHALESGLNIEYRVGSGERLFFDDASFDHVACCDVLEHVDDLDGVLGEIARVLKPGGLFLYDTINRTAISRLVMIKIMQEWPSTAVCPANVHVWEKFIRPIELIAMLKRHGLDQREMRGISTRRNPIAIWLDLRRRAKARISFKELGRRLGFRESGFLSASYMGYAVRTMEIAPPSESGPSHDAQP
jgi:2-polyprenyl-6-hydroxyphenyl methylase / 3-demethylubiquinone-9 3-methyltransferase